MNSAGNFGFLSLNVRIRFEQSYPASYQLFGELAPAQMTNFCRNLSWFLEIRLQNHFSISSIFFSVRMKLFVLCVSKISFDQPYECQKEHCSS